MSAGNSQETDQYSSTMNLDDTELTLGLPGGENRAKSVAKRGFSETVDLCLGGSSIEGGGKVAKKSDAVAEMPENEVSGASSKPPAAKYASLLFSSSYFLMNLASET